MAKPGKAHINLTTPGEYDYLASIRFDHDQSECLRLTEIRLKDKNSQKPYKLPHNLLTWFTEHAPAGREITRDDNKLKHEANLYVELSSLREQIETFGLKSPFLIEIYINELDRNDEALARSDNGVTLLEVNLYEGPKATCKIDLYPLTKTVTSTEKAAPSALIFPENIGAQGRFDLATAILKANEGPLDPRIDKRVMLADIELKAPFQAVRHTLIERLALYRGQDQQPRTYVRDSHQYEELYPSHPLDQKSQFPEGVMLFGPLLPQGPKEKEKPLTIALNAPITDPIWQQIQELQNSAGKPLAGTLHLILPQPGENKHKRLSLQLVMDKNPWLLITNGTAHSQPSLIALTPTVSKKELELTLPAPLDETADSEFLCIQHYHPQATRQDQPASPLNIALNPKNKETTTHIIRPEVLEITENERQFVLINQVPSTKKQKIKQSEFKIKCFWPERQESINHTLLIKWEKPKMTQSFAVDFGSKTITLARRVGAISHPISLGKLTQNRKISENCLPSSVAVSSSAQKVEDQQQAINDQNWHANTYPLSVSYEVLPWQEQALQTRLIKYQRHYDIALPSPASGTPTTICNLKRAFAQNKIDLAGNHQSSDEHDKKDQQFFITNKYTQAGATNPEIGLTKQINPTDLMADCLNELIDFYGTYLPRIYSSEPQTVKQKNAAATLLDSTALVITHPDYLTHAGLNRYRSAGAKALALYEQGSFNSLGAAAELIGLTSFDDALGQIHLVPESAAGAYHCLKALAIEDQPVRSKKIQQIHMDIGFSSATVTAFNGCIGESNALIEHQFGSINLPLGGRTLELMLAKECAAILETALNNGAPITLEAPLPLTYERIEASQFPQNEAERIGHNFIMSLRRSIDELVNNQQSEKAAPLRGQPLRLKSGNDFHLCLAKSTGTEWPFSLATTTAIADEPIALWQGLRGEKIMLVPKDNKTEWQLELHCSLKLMCEKVGPLSTYLAFLTDFLPRTILNCFPGNSEADEHVISLVGGTSLFPAIQHHLAVAAKKINARLLNPAESYDQAKLAVAEGALALITHQSTAPLRLIAPNLVLSPQTVDKAQDENLVAMAQSGNATIILHNKASGPIPPDCISLQLIETIPGLGPLLKSDPAALSCRSYLADLDHANASEWALAEKQWADWLSHCYQTILNMAVPSTEGAENDNTPQQWGFKALQENEAEFSIGTQTYWVSSGLTTPET